MWKSWWFSCKSAGHFLCVIIIDLLLDRISEKTRKKTFEWEDPDVNADFKWCLHLALVILMVFLILFSKLDSFFLLTSRYHVRCFRKISNGVWNGHWRQRLNKRAACFSIWPSKTSTIRGLWRFKGLDTMTHLSDYYVRKLSCCFLWVECLLWNI